MCLRARVCMHACVRAHACVCVCVLWWACICLFFDPGLYSENRRVREVIVGSVYKTWGLGLPWWSSGRESACQCRGRGFDLWSGKIPHAFFTVQLSHPYMTTGKTIALTRQTFIGTVMPLLFNMLSRLVITFLPRGSLNIVNPIKLNFLKYYGS